MEILQHLLTGFEIALSIKNLIFCFMGVTLGTLIGVLPGIGPVTGVAILIPITFGMDATTAIITMAGVYYGAMYGGSTTSILLNVPGESSSVMTTLDGYQMALKGRAGPALGMAAIARPGPGTRRYGARQWGRQQPDPRATAHTMRRTEGEYSR